MENKLYVSYAPHIRSKENVSETMLDVLIALIPALAAGVYFFGVRALFAVLVSVACSVAFESLWNMLLKKKNTVGDMLSLIHICNGGGFYEYCYCKKRKTRFLFG